MHRPLLPKGHLDVQACRDRSHRIAQAEDEIGRDETVEAPLFAQDVGQQHLVLAAVRTVHRVVRTHHTGDATLHDPFEVRQVHLVQRPLVDLHVDAEAGILHRVQGEVLHARHHVLLRPQHQRPSHFADQQWFFAVGLLGSAPPGMSQQVDAHPAVVGAAHAANLGTDCLTDSMLQVGVESRTSGHADGKRRLDTDHASPRAVAELDAGDAQPLDHCRREGALMVRPGHHRKQSRPRVQIAVQAVELLGGGQLGHDLSCGMVRRRRAGGDIGHCPLEHAGLGQGRRRRVEIGSAHGH